MSGLMRCWGLGVAFMTFCAAATASAQENLEAGKTPAQLYASNCAICHKSPHGLSKGAGIFGLDSFLREHYTSSHESAAAITAYLQAIDREPEPAHERSKRASKGEHKGEHKAKLTLPPSKPSTGKTEGKTEAKTEAKPKAKSEAKTDANTDAKTEATSESKTSTKSESKKSETKTDATKKDAAKKDAAKTDAAKSDKDAKPEKSD